MGENPSRFQDPERPVEQVSWEDCAGLSRAGSMSGSPGWGCSLPSEAQWEYACRAGTETALYSGPIEILGEHNAPALDVIAWYGGNSGVDYDLDEAHDTSVEILERDAIPDRTRRYPQGQGQGRECLGPVRHARQRLGVGRGWLARGL